MRVYCLKTYIRNKGVLMNEQYSLCVLLAQWITWLTRDRCNPNVPSSIPAGGKDFP